MADEDGKPDKKVHRERKSGRKADKKQSKNKHVQELTDKQRNPKAFTFNSVVRAERNFRRTKDIQTKKHHIPLVDRTPIEPPPIIVAIVGPPKVGKTTLIQSLVKHFSKQRIPNIHGPVTIVIGKKRRITLIECNNDMNSMIDIGKVADLVLLLIDGSFGFEMDTFEFINICQTHGMPRIMGILTHLDLIESKEKLKDIKKKLKHRLWTDLYQGAKLFYLSGMMHKEYLKNEIQNLARFISIIKFRPIVWRTTHPYILADRLEDITQIELIRKNPKVDRTVSLYGYVRGIPMNKSNSIHIPGCGDMKIEEMMSLPDPCSLPDKIKNRSLDGKERLIYAPFSGVGGIVYDKDAVYIELGNSSHHYMKQGSEIISNILKSQESMKRKIEHSEIQLFSNSESTEIASTHENESKRRKFQEELLEEPDIQEELEKELKSIGVEKNTDNIDEEQENDSSDDDDEWEDDESDCDVNEVENPDNNMGVDEDDDLSQPQNDVNEKENPDNIDEEQENDSSDDDEWEDDESDCDVNEVENPDNNMGVDEDDDLSQPQNDVNEKENPDNIDEEQENDSSDDDEWEDDESDCDVNEVENPDNNRGVDEDDDLSQPQDDVNEKENIDEDEKDVSSQDGDSWDDEEEEDDVKENEDDVEEMEVELNEAIESSVKWKENLAQKASDAFLERQSNSHNLWKLVYCNDTHNEREKTENDNIGELFHYANKRQKDKLEERDDQDQNECSRFTVSHTRNWDDELVRLNISDCFVTGKWKKSQDARELLRLDDIEDDDDDDEEMFGDFEDMETGEKHEAEPSEEKKKAPTKKELIEKKKKLKEQFNAEYDDNDGGKSLYDDLKEEMNVQSQLNKTEFEGLDENIRQQLEGFRPGLYVRLQVSNVPCELVENFDPDYPLIIGGLNAGEENVGYLQLRIKMHRYYKKPKKAILKSNDPLIISLGWRRFQTIPVYAQLEDNLRQRYLKYTLPHLSCIAHIWGPVTIQGTGMLAIQHLSRDQEKFRIAATGMVTELDQSSQITKKLKLIGKPIKIYNKTAFIKEMFNSPLEVAKFEGAKIKTVSGIRGQVKKAVKSGGDFRATFEDKIKLSDIVFCNTWVKVDIEQFYNPICNLLLPKGQKNHWLLMKTLGELKRERDIRIEPNPDNLYTDIVRKQQVFKPLVIPKSLQRELPYKDKPKKKFNKKNIDPKNKRIAVIKEPSEQRVSKMMRMLKTAYQSKREKTKMETHKRMTAYQNKREKEEFQALKRQKELRKQVFRTLSKMDIKDAKKQNKKF